jgi:hypothetical protein
MVNVSARSFIGVSISKVNFESIAVTRYRNRCYLDPTAPTP